MLRLLAVYASASVNGCDIKPSHPKDIYFATLSQIGTVYGSLTTAIAVLLSLELAATLLLLGAQVISEYERFGDAGSGVALPFKTRAV